MDKGMDAEGEGRNRVLRPVPPITRTREEHRHHRACAARPQARTASLSPRPDRLRHDDHRGRRRDREQTADRAIGELAAEESRGEERQTDPGHLAQGASRPVPSPQPRQAAFATRRVGVSVDSGRDHAALEGGCPPAHDPRPAVGAGADGRPPILPRRECHGRRGRQRRRGVPPRLVLQSQGRPSGARRGHGPDDRGPRRGAAGRRGRGMVAADPAPGSQLRAVSAGTSRTIPIVRLVPAPKAG